MNLNSNDSNKPKVSSDPGWNDPPTFSYDSSVAAGQVGKRGPVLNKRVAFPLRPTQTGSPSAQPPLPAMTGDAPPLRPPMAPPCAVSSPSGRSPIEFQQLPEGATKILNLASLSCDYNEAVEKGVNVLLTLWNTLPTDDKRERDEIRKRLDILHRMCKENKLNPDIYGRIVELATALQCGDTTLASNIQAGLMVDHVALCSSWMSGVRLLVRRKTDPDPDA